MDAYIHQTLVDKYIILLKILSKIESAYEKMSLHVS